MINDGEETRVGWRGVWAAGIALVATLLLLGAQVIAEYERW